MASLETNFGVNPEDARALAQQLVTALGQTPDGSMNQVLRVTSGEAATLKILYHLGRTDITDEQRFQYISDCRFGDIMSMQTVLGLMTGQGKEGENHE